MEKEEALKYTILLLENLINSIGTTLNEYHWRELAGASKALMDSFPEYNLFETVQEHYKTLPRTPNVQSVDDIFEEF